MFTYDGYGCVISVADAGGEMAFLGAYNECFGQNATDMNQFDNDMVLGTYESPDNVDSAYVGGESIETRDGVVIIELPDTVWDIRGEYPQLDSMMRMLGFENWIDDPNIVGNYEVVCEQ